MVSMTHQDNGDAVPTDSLIDRGSTMEMTRVDVVGNKSTSYNLLKSNAKKMEIVGSDKTRVIGRAQRYVPYAIVILYAVVFALVFFSVYDYTDTRSQIEMLRNEIKELRTQSESSRIQSPPVQAIDNRNNQQEYVATIEKQVQENITQLNNALQETRLLTTSQKKKLENAEVTVQSLTQRLDGLSETVDNLNSSIVTAPLKTQEKLEKTDLDVQNLKQRLDGLSETVDRSYSSLLNDTSALKTELETQLKNELALASTKLEEKTSLLETNSNDTRRKLDGALARIMELEGRIHDQRINLGDAINKSNNSLTTLIEDMKQETESKLVKFDGGLRSELSDSQARIAQLETRIEEVNKTAQSVADSLTVSEALASLNISGPGASSGDLKPIQDELVAVRKDVTKMKTQVDNLNSLHQLETEMSSLQNEVNKHSNNLSTLNRNFTRLSDALNRQNDESNRTLQQLEAHSKSVSDQSVQINAIKEALKILGKKNSPVGS